MTSTTPIHRIANLVAFIGTTLFASYDLYACSSLSFSSNARTYFAANYDFPNQLEDGLLFVNPRGVSRKGWSLNVENNYVPDEQSERFEWKSKYGSLTFNLVGYAMVWGGINEKGVCVSTLELPGTIPPVMAGKLRMNGCLWLQYVLDTCSSLEEVVSTLSRFTIETTNHYHFCDKDGNTLFVEFIDGQCKLLKGKASDGAVLTNSSHADSIKAFADPSTIHEDPEASLRRYCIIRDRHQAFKKSEDADAIRFAFRTLDKANLGPTPTQWNIVFDFVGKKVYFRTRAHRDIRRIDLSRVAFAAQSGVQMMPIQSSHEGDVTSKLQPYEHQSSYEHLKNFIARYFRYAELPKLEDLDGWTLRMTRHLENNQPNR